MTPAGTIAPSGAAVADVSVVIPCFNAASTLARAVTSALANDAVAQVIVADDGSADDSRQVAERLGARVRFLAGPNGGAPSARNRGAAAAATRFVLFLDSDDFLDPGYVDALRSAALADTDVVLGAYRRVAVGGAVFDQVGYPVDLPPSRALGAYLSRPTQTGAFLWRRAFLDRIGGWDETLAIYQDAELTMRALLATDAVVVADTGDRFAYWLDNESDARLSRRFTVRKAESTLTALDRHRAAILATGEAGALDGLAARYYSLARLSFRNDLDDVGARALSGFRSLGHRGHRGSLTHRLASGLLGLRAKTRLERRLAGRRAR